MLHESREAQSDKKSELAGEVEFAVDVFDNSDEEEEKEERKDVP